MQTKHVAKSLDEVLQELDAHPVPKGVDAALYARLKAELKRLLIARGNGKSVSTAPDPNNPENAVTDLLAIANPLATQTTLTWTEVMKGDYDNNAQVDLDDMTPLGLYYGLFVGKADLARDQYSLHNLVDGDYNPTNSDGAEITIVDLQAIARNINRSMVGYHVYRYNYSNAHQAYGWWRLPNANRPPFPPPPPPYPSTRPAYSYVDSDLSDIPLWNLPAVKYRVLPYDPPTSEGPQSNEATIILNRYFVSGTVTRNGVGFPGVTVTLFTNDDPQHPVPIQRTATNALGRFTFLNVVPGLYGVSPWISGYSFTPNASYFAVTNGNIIYLSFAGSAATFDGEVTITDMNSGAGVQDIEVDLTKPDNTPYVPYGDPPMKTDANGKVEYTGLTTGLYQVALYKSGYHFEPDQVSWRIVAQPVLPAKATIQLQCWASIATTPWAKFHGDLQNTGQSPWVGPQTNNVKWTCTLSGSIEGSPVADGAGSVYVCSTDDSLYAIDAADGSVEWSAQTNRYLRGSPCLGADGTVYVGSWDNHLYAYSAVGGGPLWSLNTGSSIAGSPTIGIGGTVYVTAAHFNPGATYALTVYALNPHDGSLKSGWPYSTASPGGIIDLPEYMLQPTPALDTQGTIYVGGWDGLLYAINPDGTNKWTSHFNDGPYSNDRHVQSSAAIDANGTLYVGTDYSNVYALDPSGVVKWTRSTNGYVVSSPAVSTEGTVYVGSDDYKIYALNSADGSIKWTFATSGEVESSPAIGNDNTVYVGSGDGTFYALNGTDGSLKWSYSNPTRARFRSSPAIDSDGTIYVGCFDGKLYAFGQ